MEFDAESAASLYATKTTDELINIAFLDFDYVTQAKELAKQELSRRGIRDVGRQELVRVQAQRENEEREKLEHNTTHLESVEELPGWRKAARAALAPYRRVLQGVAIGGILVLGLNSFFEWNLLNLNAKRSHGLVMVIFLLWFVFLMPTREEFIAQVQSSKKPNQPSG